MILGIMASNGIINPTIDIDSISSAGLLLSVLPFSFVIQKLESFSISPRKMANALKLKPNKVTYKSTISPLKFSTINSFGKKRSNMQTVIETIVILKKYFLVSFEQTNNEQILHINSLKLRCPIEFIFSIYL